MSHRPAVLDVDDYDERGILMMHYLCTHKLIRWAQAACACENEQHLRFLMMHNLSTAQDLSLSPRRKTHVLVEE